MAARNTQPSVSPFSADLRRMGRKLPPALANAKHPGTVQRIVTAAEGFFAEKGLEGARTGAIARAARVNKALLYYYFRSKQDLHRFTLEMLFSQLRDEVGGKLDERVPPRQRLLNYVNGYFDFVVAHANYPRLVQRQVMSRGAGLAELVDDYFRPLQDRLGATLREGITKGEFRDVDPPQTVLTLIAITVFYFAAAPVVSRLWRCDSLAPARVAARRRAVLDFLEHGLFTTRARTR